MRRALLSATVCGLLAAPVAAHAVSYSPVDQPGPPLSVSQADLDDSLDCTGDVINGTATRSPVLLIAGTAEDPSSTFSWNYEPALTAASIPWCAVTLPNHEMGDIQVNAEYVVNAIRYMHQATGRRIGIIGHSQGGMVPRWALRFWPDTRPMVDDLIGLAPSNHGTVSAQGACVPDCAPAVWQQRDNAELIKAVNSFQETFPGISYSVIYTRNDEIVTPNLDDSGSSSLHGGGGQVANVAIQDVCQTDLSEHLAIATIDAVAYALAIDALNNPGPADPSPAHVPITVCAQPFMPGIAPGSGQARFTSFLASVGSNFGSAAHVAAEPPLKCYVVTNCGGSSRSAPLGGGRGGIYGPALSKCGRKKRKKHRRHRKRCRHRKKSKKGHR